MGVHGPWRRDKAPRRRRKYKQRLKFHENMEPKRTPIGWALLVWILVLAGSIYIPFVRAPKMTNIQLFTNYWWFYAPALVAILIITFREHWRD